MNEGLSVIGKMKEGVLKANESAYENRGIRVQENEKKTKEDEKKKEAEEAAEL